MRGWMADQSILAALVGVPLTPAKVMLPLRLDRFEYSDANCAGTCKLSLAMLAGTICASGLGALGSNAPFKRLYFSSGGALMSKRRPQLMVSRGLTFQSSLIYSPTYHCR